MDTPHGPPEHLGSRPPVHGAVSQTLHEQVRVGVRICCQTRGTLPAWLCGSSLGSGLDAMPSVSLDSGSWQPQLCHLLAS